MKVDFIVIGAMKAGTTSLYETLKDHPEISFSKVKETHFFSKSTDWKKELPKYHELFEKGEGMIYGEASTSYAFRPQHQNVAEKIYAYNPNMKLIYIVRNPINRSISHYMHSFAKGYTKLSIDEEVKNNAQIIQVSRYYYQIKPYLELFGREQIYFIDFKDFIKDRQSVLKDLADFLGIDPDPLLQIQEQHANPTIGVVKLHPRFGKFIQWMDPFLKLWPERFRLFVKKLIVNKNRVFQEKPKMKEHTKQKIIESIEPEIPKLEKLLDKDLSSWTDC